MKICKARELVKEIDFGLTFDDVQISPCYSEIESRKEIIIKTELVSGLELDHPLIPANMDTISSLGMVKTANKFGSICFLHRFKTMKETILELNEVLKFETKYIGVSIGVKSDDLEKTKQIYHFLKRVNEEHKLVILIDVAHGHHKLVCDMISRLKFYNNSIKVIAGNVATYDGARLLIDCGADGLKVGIGPGSLCSTRINTGCGVPQFSAIVEVRRAIDLLGGETTLIADGGIKYVGDIVKAIGAGADSVMSGYLFAGTSDTPGKIIEKGLFPNETLWKVYRGSASRESKIDRGETSNIEGATVEIPYKGESERIYRATEDGIKSGLSYSGFKNLKDSIGRMMFTRVSNSSIIEAGPNALHRYGG